MLRLHDMKRFITAALESVSNQSQQAFDDDEMLRDASLYRILVVAEAASDLPTGLTSHYPHIDWKELVGMGNRLKHQYFRVESPFPWKTLTVDFPVLLTVVEEMIASLTAKTPNP